MRVLYVGGTGEISTSCVRASVAEGHDVTVFNRGTNAQRLSDGVTHVAGDLGDRTPYAHLADQRFDVVCQFLAFTPETIDRDVAFFSGRCGQYLFVSTASAYQKNPHGERINEATPLDNPFWAYSRAKADCERHLRDAAIPATIVRPSHTYDTRLPSTVIDGNHLAWRMTNGKPVLVHDGGRSLWTLTHAEDFARAFVKLHGNEAALGEDFHITSDNACSWSEILTHVAAALGCDAEVRGIESRTLISHIPELEGPLLGDKANTMVFDNSKIRAVAPGWQCRIGLDEGMTTAAERVMETLANGYAPDQKLDALIDDIIDTEAV